MVTVMYGVVRDGMTSRSGIIPTFYVVGVLLLGAVISSACSREDPARAALRARLKQPATLSSDELRQFREEVGRTIEGRTFHVKLDAIEQPLDEARRKVVFGMLTDPAGLFDEGLKTREGSTCRILNAPGESNDLEIEASRRLWVNTDTLLPERFEFNLAVPSASDYSFDLISKK
jgi:hypothetical protein